MIPVNMTPKKRSKAQAVPESGVLRACLELLTAERIWHERRNTGAFTGEHKGKKRFVQFSRPGTADIMVTPRSWHFNPKAAGAPAILWVECKSGIGKQTAEQLKFQQEVEDAGHAYLLVSDPDTLKEWLIEHGAMRRK